MKEWIEAMRLRTLPTGLAGVMAGTGVALYHHGFSLLPFLICIVFVLLAQISSNFANEYYDYKNGFDKKGREGFRRGVTEGDIKPEAMKKATYLTLIAACCIGATLIIWGGWWLIFIGIAIGIFALAYSAGPYPLSHHGLGDVTVVIFYGIIPVVFTQYVQTRIFYWDGTTIFTSLAIGLMAANVLIVNNYRDMDDDREAGKHTTVVIFGRKTMERIYYINGVISAILLAMASSRLPFWVSAGWLTYFAIHTVLWEKLRHYTGSKLNVILKWTSLLLFCVSIYLLIIFATLKEVSTDYIEFINLTD